MNTRTGEIISEELAHEMNRREPGLCKPMELPLTDKQERTRYIGKYEPCPCGSGKKFKWCCYTGTNR